jgi:hypothetical protein
MGTPGIAHPSSLFEKVEEGHSTYLYLWVLSIMTPQTTDPTIPAMTNRDPIIPASFSAPLEYKQRRFALAEHIFTYFLICKVIRSNNMSSSPDNGIAAWGWAKLIWRRTPRRWGRTSGRGERTPCAWTVWTQIWGIVSHWEMLQRLVWLEQHSVGLVLGHGSLSK